MGTQKNDHYFLNEKIGAIFKKKDAGLPHDEAQQKTQTIALQPIKFGKMALF